jgi:prepilin-type N-terminal cleavage/methylation domain-containing protein
MRMRVERTMSSQRREQGVTLMELMISLTILAVGMLTLVISQLHAIRQSSEGHHSTDSANIARTHLEMVQRLPWGTLDAAEAIGAWTAPTWPQSDATVSMLNTRPDAAGDAVQQGYTVRWKVANVGANTCLRDVDVKIEWEDEAYDRTRAATLSTRRYNWGGAGC